MGTVLLVGLDEAERSALAELRQPAVVTTAAELDRLLGADVDVVVLSGLDPVGAVATMQQVHRRLPTVQVVVLVTDGTEPELRRHVRFAADVPADLRLLDAESDALVDELTDVSAEAVRRRSNEQVLADIGTRVLTHPAAAPVVGATLGTLLEHAPLGVVVADVEGRVLACNRAASDLLRVTDPVAGRPLRQLFVDPLLTDRLVLAASMTQATDPWPEETTRGRDGSHLDVSAAMTQLDDGRHVVMLLIGDATVRLDAEKARDVLSEQVAMMGRVSEALVGTQDPEEAVRLIADQVVPTLADWVSIQLYDERGATQHVVARHSDPRLAALTDLVQRNLGEAMSEESPSRRLARGEPPILLEHITEEMLGRFVPDPDVRHNLLEIGADSLIAVPLEGRRTRVGSMVLVNGSGARRLGNQARAIAVEVGRRVGIALETLHLYSEQRALAEELQRSLLTEPPSPRRAEIAARYLPASQAIQVGGDWYDAFLQPDGAVVLSIGDVVGHDYRAAATMGQLRGLLRGIGYARGVGPADMLRSLDQAIEGLLPGTTATAVAATVTQGARHDGDTEAGVALKMCWSNAGHPPPALLAADGTVRLLGEERTDVLLGVAAQLPRAEASTELRHGDTVVLYSDGLVERRGRDIDDGITALVDALTGGVGLPLQQLCDRLLAELVPDEHDDDVALVALRVR